MRKIGYAAFLVVVGLIVGSCVSSRDLPLDVDQLENRQFELVGIFLRSNGAIDEDQGFRRFLDMQLESLIEVVETVGQSQGVEVTTSAFIEAYERGEIEVEFTADEISSSFTLHSYLWERETDADQQARVSILFAPQGGQIPSDLILAKDNLEDPERPFRSVTPFTIVVEDGS